MKSFEIEKYVDAVFGFCLRRLNNPDEARDLSQEILCEVLAALSRSEVSHPEALLWKIARNRYCRHIRRRSQSPVLLDDGGLLNSMACEVPEELAEEKQAVFTALHSLAASHREIMIDFYVSSLSCDQIAAARGLPLATVRSRLFYGREKLRKRWLNTMEENRIYSPQEWFLTGNGDVDPSLLQRQVVRSIALACYDRPATAEQISIKTGIPCLYVEDELQDLLEHEIVERVGERYRTSTIIHREGFAQRAEALLKQQAEPLADKLVPLLREAMPAVRTIGFYGSDLPAGRLWWSLIPILMREACQQARTEDPDLVRGSFPLRRDGSRGWLCAYVSPGGAHRYFSGCNAYYLEGSRYRYYWSQDLFSEELNQLLKRLENVAPAACPPFFDGELLAECVRCDLAVHSEGRIRWNTPVLTGAQAQALQTLAKQSSTPLLPILSLLAHDLHTLMKKEIPSHLHNQIRGIFGIEFNSVIAMICEELLRRSILETPKEGCFAGQVIMLAQNTQSLRL